MKRSAVALLLATAWLAGCDGENLFRDGSGGVNPNDRREPGVTIVEPDSGQRVAVGDSVFLQIQATDDQGIAEIELTGFTLLGSAELGTITPVPRFVPKVVDLTAVRPVVRDTVILRYLVATGDSVAADTVLLVARATDFGGNVTADTVRIAVGGPRAQITAPSAGTQVRPGAQILVRLAAADTTHRLQTVRLTATGAISSETVLRFDPPRASVDTLIPLNVPLDAPTGTVELRVMARNTVNDSTISQPVSLQVLPAATDTRAPSVRFRVTSPARAEQSDSIAVTVTATDSIRVERVGVTLLTIHRLGTGTDTLSTRSFTASADSATFRVSLADLAVPVPIDTSTARVEVTAFAFDTSGNCATATVPSTTLSEACTSTNPVFGVRSGARFEILVVRGRTIRVGEAGDRIVDIAADSSDLYFTNFTKNRVEVLPIGGTSFEAPISVGSRPWGLAFNQQNSRLYVANSGATTISVVDPNTRAEQEIQTPNVKLYDVAFETRLVPDPASGDSVLASFPTSVTRFDYSDRPQFIGVTDTENVIYSTVPTAAARDGTIRIMHRNIRPTPPTPFTGDRLEIITDYAEERVGGKLVIAQADSAFLVPADPNNFIRVCPRNRSENPALDRQLPVACYVGSIESVEATIEGLGYDTEFRYNINIQEVGLSDTTFVAVSGQHNAVAVGEGVAQFGRIVTFFETGGGSVLIKHGEIRDLVGNAAERIFGLALNNDGSLGLARGSEAFFFSDNLRLQGFVNTEPGAGGVEMHPDHPAVERAFVPGVEPNGLAFIDVMETDHYSQVRRIYIRDPIIGPLRAARMPGGSLKLYGITAGGVISVDVRSEDLTR